MFVPIGSNSGESYQVQRSLRFRASASAYLSRANSVAGNLTTMTLVCARKRGVLGVDDTVFGTSENGGLAGYGISVLRFTSSGALRFVHTNPSTGGALILFDTVGFFRDPTAFLHIVLSIDTRAPTSAGISLTVNGVNQSLTFSAYTQNAAIYYNNTGISQYIGRSGSLSPTDYADGLFAEIYKIDGQALPPSAFGEYDTLTTTYWKPKSPAQVRAAVAVGGGTRNGFGTSGFYLPFSDPTSLTTLMYDRSQSDTDTTGNNWTANNISLTAGSTYDSMLDVPLGGGGNERGNYATLNPLDFTTVGTLTSGNLKFTQLSAFSRSGRASVGMSSGKWYWEVTCTQGNISPGIGNASMSLGGYVGADSNGWSFGSDGLKYNGGSGSAYSSIYNVNDVIGIGYDADTGTLTYYKNGTSQGTAFTGLSGTMFPAFSSSGSGNVIAEANFGQRPFAYTPPAGFKALHTGNLTNTTVVTSGSYTGNLSTDGPCIWCNGTPETLTINGNAVTWGTHADKLATGFKIRTASSSYNSSGTNTWTATYLSPSNKSAFKYQNAKGNP